VRLDDYLTNTGIKRLDFVKLDVDGFECHVLGGGLTALKKFRPLVLMELSPYLLTERGRSAAELVGILKQAGYNLFRLDGKTAVSYDTGLLQKLIPDDSIFNVIGRPA
jgi:hypothetical protein